MSLSRVVVNAGAAARRHRIAARNARAMRSAIARAATPGMRDELIVVAQRNTQMGSSLR